ncbi:NACHT domain-containing NTPase, partial [Vibrio sp. 10N.222.52.C12]|uniref:NACHT domain-containing protein n=1 Tax=Vibrio sp. 10N.222.52.C12 TaxID=3229630 RepID=UPI00354E7E02
GFDELDINLRNDYEKQIIGLTDKYHNIKILISTRYDSRFNSWQEFHSYTVLPLDKEKSKTLISKLNYDRQVKSKFLISLENELYEKHQSFASNPLLLTMMLLTYEQIAEIPNKIHLFYEQAFLTLFNKHDSIKNLYKRKSYTNLALDQFKRVMASFSIISYSENKYYFEHEAIIPLLEKSLRLVDVKVDPVSYLKDLIENVCILQRDGTGYTFTHRSFQEYFSAIFLVNMSNSNKFGIIDKISNLNHNDDIIYMVYDMNPDMLVKEWIIPKMEELVGRYSILPSSFDGQLEGLKMMYDGISYFDRSILDEEEGNKSKSEETTEFRSSIAYSINSGTKGNDSSFFHTLGRIYNQEYRDVYKAIAESYTSYEIERHNDLISKEIITEEDLKWDEMDSLDAETRKHIVEAGACKVVNHRIDWLKYKIIELKKGQETKQEDIFELLLN